VTEPFQYRDADGHIRLDELLGERYVRHYTGILNSSSEKFAAMQLGMMTAEPEAEETVPWAAWDPRDRPAPPGWQMRAEGQGPDQASSCQALAVLPEVVWDVCGYYRRLGVPWDATTRQLRLAYLGKDPQQRDEKLHYALMQLLDPVIRRAYDLMPLGGLFMGDRDVQEMLEKAAAMEASRRNAEDPWDEHDQGEVLKEWGFEKGVTPEEARERLRGDAHAETPLGSEAGTLGATLPMWDRHWTWFRLSDPQGIMDTPDPRELEAWQAMLCQAFTEAGAAVRFAVGIWPGHAPKIWRDSKECCIVFLGNEQPTQDMARDAARGFLAQRH
jgi:hypothetical protein